MQLSFRFKIFISFIFIIISSFLFYFLSNQQPFQVLYDNGFDTVLNYIIKSETPERIKFLITDLDVYYWNIIVASIFFITIIIIGKTLSNFPFKKMKKEYSLLVS